MKFCVIVVVLICFTSALHQNPFRNKRSIFKLFNGIVKCSSRECPPWKCQDDSAVVHGYCCGCPGSEHDNVPVPCYPNLRCPASPQPLCVDYNFMMNCCCTGS